VSAIHVSYGFFEVFGATPFLGRTFTAQEDLPNAGKFVVLTHGVWKNRMGGDASVAGKLILLNSEPYTVLGVLPETYQPDPPTELYLPEQFDPNSTNQGHIYIVTARLRPGASMESARAEFVLHLRLRNIQRDAVR